MTKNPYLILQVSANAKLDEVKTAYKKLTLKFHPDVNKEHNAEEKFMEIVNAYKSIISNFDKDGKPIKEKEITINKTSTISKISKLYDKKNIIEKFNFRFKILKKFTKFNKTKNSYDFDFTVDSELLNLGKKELISRFRTSENKFVRSESLKALIMKEKRSSYKMLNDALDDISKEVRIVAIKGIGILRIRQSIPRLKSLYEDSSIGIKQEIIKSLARINLPSVHDFIIQACFAEDKLLRMQALRTLQKTKTKNLYKNLSPLLYDPDEEIKSLTKEILYQQKENA